MGVSLPVATFLPLACLISRVTLTVNQAACPGYPLSWLSLHVIPSGEEVPAFSNAARYEHGRQPTTARARERQCSGVLNSSADLSWGSESFLARIVAALARTRCRRS